MKDFVMIHPEVAGTIAKSDFIDKMARPPKINQLVYEFRGWLGDDLLTSIATFIVTDRLRTAIEIEKLTGVEFDDVKTVISDQFMELYGNKTIPKFYWMKITGVQYVDDFSLSSENDLLVSPNGMNLLKGFQISNAEVSIG